MAQAKFDLLLLRSHAVSTSYRGKLASPSSSRSLCYAAFSMSGLEQNYHGESYGDMCRERLAWLEDMGKLDTVTPQELEHLRSAAKKRFGTATGKADPGSKSSVKGVWAGAPYPETDVTDTSPLLQALRETKTVDKEKKGQGDAAGGKGPITVKEKEGATAMAPTAMVVVREEPSVPGPSNPKGDNFALFLKPDDLVECSTD